MQEQSEKVLRALAQASMHSLFNKTICLSEGQDCSYLHKNHVYRRRRHIFNEIVQASENFSIMPKHTTMPLPVASTAQQRPKVVSTVKRDLRQVQLNAVDLSQVFSFQSNRFFRSARPSDQSWRPKPNPRPSLLNLDVHWKSPFLASGSKQAATAPWENNDFLENNAGDSVEELSLKLREELYSTPAVPQNTPRHIDEGNGFSPLRYMMQLIPVPETGDSGDEEGRGGNTFRRLAYRLMVVDS